MKKSFNKFTLLITLLICMLPFLNVAATDNNQLLPFANSVEVDGLTIMVDDPNGIIPNGAYLDVKKVKQKKNILDFSNSEELKIDKSEYEDIQNAVEELKEENSKGVEESYILDISIKDSNGKEIEPNDSVKLIFKKQNTNQALVANVYHIVDDGSNKQAELLTSETRIENNESITVTETDSFSYYQIEFTYNELQYIMPNDTEEEGIINLKTVLDYVGLTGDVQNVRVSNDELYSVEKNEENEWIIIAHKPFSTKEHTYVIINDVEYDIITTDFFVREGYVLNNCGATATKITITGANGKSYPSVANNSSVGGEFNSWGPYNGPVTISAIFPNGKTRSTSTYVSDGHEAFSVSLCSEGDVVCECSNNESVSCNNGATATVTINENGGDCDWTSKSRTRSSGSKTCDGCDYGSCSTGSWSSSISAPDCDHDNTTGYDTVTYAKNTGSNTLSPNITTSKNSDTTTHTKHFQTLVYKMVLMKHHGNHMR